MVILVVAGLPWVSVNEMAGKYNMAIMPSGILFYLDGRGKGALIVNML